MSMEPQWDIMLDLETFGLGPTAAIIQIGAVEFDPHCGRGLHVIGRRFRADVALQSSLVHGMTVDEGTVSWWADRTLEVLHQRQLHSLPAALGAFMHWWNEGTNAGAANVWSHGLAFDVPIMEFAYRQCHSKPPWHYRNTRDQRTLQALATSLGFPAVERVEPEHEALKDAEAQAMANQNYHTYIMELIK